MLNMADLPDDAAALKAIVIAVHARNARLELLVAAFRKAMFGRKSERLDPDQFELALEDIETGIATIRAGEEACEVVLKPAVSSPRAANRGSLPKHLPRIEEGIEPDTQICGCGGDLHQIGEVEEDQKTVWGTVFPTTVRTAGCDPGPVPRHCHPPSEVCLSVVPKRCGPSACTSAPDRGRHADRGDGGAWCWSAIEGGPWPQWGRVSPLRADHLPLYRHAQIYGRQGIDLDRSTLAAWVGKAAYELKPVFTALIADLKRSNKLFMDETRAPVLDPKAGKIEPWCAIGSSTMARNRILLVARPR